MPQVDISDERAGLSIPSLKSSCALNTPAYCTARLIITTLIFILCRTPFTGMLLYEDYFFRSLYEQYGDQAIQYYGMCSYKQNTKIRNETMTDFSTGDTLFLELAKPVSASWTMNKQVSNTLQLNNDDLESLRVVARQYDGFVGGRLRMGPDNKFAHQYVRAAAGIRHADFDMVKVLSSYSPSVLRNNCKILLGKFAGRNREDVSDCIHNAIA